MAVMIWHFILMPAFLLPVGLAWLIKHGWGRLKPRPAGAPEPGRRAFLSAVVVALPPLATAGLVAQSKLEENQLRLREFELPIKRLPVGLDGLVIAHVTDPHLMSFITPEKIDAIVEMTNGIDADLVLQTGDLINSSLVDLPAGIDLVRRLRGRYGVYNIQGNHDCIDDRWQFEADTRRAGLNMLFDEARVIEAKGQRIRLMGPRWWGGDADLLKWSVDQLLPNGPDDAFPLLMVHHPHGFDPAAAAGVPLTLAGHTHGGQLALTHDIGIGPLMYRYWSGVYTKGDSTAVVSNGTGNWFPLRINVPCEVLKLTLRRA